MVKKRYRLTDDLKKRGEIHYFAKITIAVSILLGLIITFVGISYEYSYIFIPLIGALFVHMKELQHEALHNPTRWKTLNRVAGIFMGFPLFISYSEYQYFHLLHHKHIGSEKDTEYFSHSVKGEKAPSLFVVFLKNYFMLDHYSNIAKKMFSELVLKKSEIPLEDVRRKVKTEYYILLFAILLSLVASVFLPTIGQFFLYTWVLPVIFFAIPINFLIEFPEHYQCNRDSKDIFQNTRTIKSNWLATWFVNGNNYHVEHHYLPHFPISELPKIHSSIQSEIHFYHPTYLHFFRSFFKKSPES